MLLLIAVLAFMSAAFLLFRYARRRSLVTLETPSTQFSDPPHGARPLFEPTSADMSREKRAAEAREIASREYRASAELNERVDAALLKWRSSRDAQSAADLLAVTAASKREGDFSRAASEILQAFRVSSIAGLTGNDLAALIDSHYRLLPNAARSSGALFWLKQEVADLRSDV